ncbi:MAG: glycoside hydrolase family 3 C-terminal domain-containing protein [Christensenellales bacterium]
MEELKNKINDIISKMTLEQKAGLCSGKDFWTTKPIAELGVPSTMVSDGPHGLRKENNEDESLAMKLSYPATAFPPAVNLASTWNPKLAYEMGECLADQCKDQEISVILGPGTNIKRSPLCGRNFEYLSEDPYLAGKFTRKYIEGVQDNNVGTSLKHFCANNQERLRMTISSYVDERTLREIYLAPFEEAVKAKPWTVMCAYNRVNGVYCSDNKRLLTDILRDEWGFDGIVVSDWNAVNDRVAGIEAGMDLEMPSSGGENDRRIVNAVKNGTLKEEALDKVVYRLLEFVFKAQENAVKDHEADYGKAHEVARKIAEESIILLKNENNVLPWKNSDDIVVIGNLAKEFRYQGSGSSRINPYDLVSFVDNLDKLGIKYQYAQGYNPKGNERNDELFEEAVNLAKQGKKTVMFIGLTDDYESEGYDRHHLRIPKSHVELLQQVCSVNPDTVVVLLGGSPVEMPWIDDVKCLVNAYLPGEAGGEAIFNVITGKVNPSGKLAETYPIALEDYIGSQYFPMGPKAVEYREGLFVGYRYYDAAKKAVRFPFGYGLSYTTFQYSDLEVDGYNVSYTITNTGDKDGAEVSQIYVKDETPVVFKADKELKGFNKTYLKAGESKRVTYQLNERSFAFYNTMTNSWYASDGSYTIMVGSSSQNILLSKTVEMAFGKQSQPVVDYKSICPVYYDLSNVTEIDGQQFLALHGGSIESNLPKKRGEFDSNTTVGELQCCIIGKIFMAVAPSVIRSQVPDADETTMIMLRQGMTEFPIRGLGGVTSGLLSFDFLDGMVLWANKHRFKALGKLFIGLIKSLQNLSRSMAERREVARQLRLAKKEQKKADKQAQKEEKLAAKEKEENDNKNDNK